MGSLRRLRPCRFPSPHRPLASPPRSSLGQQKAAKTTVVEVDVDDGRSIARVDLTLESAALGRSTGADLSGASDFDAQGAVYEGMDVNGSTLSILPDGAFWDFEDPNHGWTLGGSNVWKRGFDSTLGSTGGVSSGSNALYTYDGNYPNGMSTTYWATSPDLACNGCSGTWELSFMRRLGVEYNLLRSRLCAGQERPRKLESNLAKSCCHDERGHVHLPDP